MLYGIGLSGLGYAFFSIQDATVKWLVASISVPEILLLRSLVICCIALLIGGRSVVRGVAGSPRKGALALRALLILMAWLSYYNAARRLPLGELTTLYFAAPIVAVVLAAAVLRETVLPARWAAVLVGFAGVVLAADPLAAAAKGAGGTGLPVAMALFAAVCWGLSVVLVRLISRSDTTPVQMLATNALFALACLPMAWATWRLPDPASLGLMLMLSLFSGLGQFFLYEGFRHAPASAVAPVEYSGLVWAFVFGFLVWGEVPGPNVVAGALLIAGASLTLVVYEARRARRLPA